MHFKVTLRNPLKLELVLDRIELLTDNAHFHTLPNHCLIVPPLAHGHTLILHAFCAPPPSEVDTVFEVRGLRIS